MDEAEKPMLPLQDLNDRWVVEGSKVHAESDAARIDALLAAELVRLSATDGGWRTLYQHRATGTLWELSYPQSEMHGGGPRRLRQLQLTTPEDWH